VRLVKGAYWDFEVVRARQEGHPCPVFVDKTATDASFEACARFLVDTPTSCVLRSARTTSARWPPH
jgi:RHH-type proline utilization regulon transcriptional repressor/proline dehydrogenase/delta 1-pyrroline-5-carboxylate dehydrogenase